MINCSSNVIRHKVGLLNLAQELGNISKACRSMGLSRDTFYRYKEAMESGGIEALFDQSRRKPNIKNRVDETTEAKVVDLAIEQPAWGQKRAANELRKQGVLISDGGVRSVWLRHGLECMKKRLKALEAKMAKENGILTEEQLALLERQKEKEGFDGEIETMHPGYLGSQDTFYVGVLKGVGRIYQQTFVDTYSKVAHAKLYNGKGALAAADLLNDRVLPYFAEKGVELLRILTDRGTEFCGKREEHEYELYLAINNIDHTKTRARSPQQNGICERFHKTILDEFYQTAFRRKIYNSIEHLQTDLDEWLSYYNNDRTHQGKMCCGRTPTKTFDDSIELAKGKQLDLLQPQHSHATTLSEASVKGVNLATGEGANAPLDRAPEIKLNEEVYR